MCSTIDGVRTIASSLFNDTKTIRIFVLVVVSLENRKKETDDKTAHLQNIIHCRKDDIDFINCVILPSYCRPRAFENDEISRQSFSNRRKV